MVADSSIIPDSVDALVAPKGSLENLSQEEITKLLDTSHSGLHALFRKCALAVLNTGNDTDNAKEILERYADFDVEVAVAPTGADRFQTGGVGGGCTDPGQIG